MQARISYLHSPQALVWWEPFYASRPLLGFIASVSWLGAGGEIFSREKADPTLGVLLIPGWES